MNPTSENLIESLYKVMCSATSTVSDSRVTNNDYFKRRVLGFKAEIEFENYVSALDDVNFLEGGQFISKKLTGEATNRNSFIYVTLSPDSPENYLTVYSTIANWDEIEQLTYIKVQENDWTTDEIQTRKVAGGPKLLDSILKPNFIFYEYNKEAGTFFESEIQNFSLILNNFNDTERTPSLYPLRKRSQFNYFNEYGIGVLKKIYANRYFLDVIMRRAQGRQIIDLDGFLTKRDSTIVVEIKEKSPIKNTEEDTNTWQYGWDSRRIIWYLYLQNKIQLKVLYNVRQINNREARDFIQWDSIYMDEFLEGVSWSNSRSGGGGEDTLLAPYSFFTRPDSKLRNL